MRPYGVGEFASCNGPHVLFYFDFPEFLVFFLPRETQETTDNINKYVQTFCISTVYVPSHSCEMFVPSKQYKLPAQMAVTQ